MSGWIKLHRSLQSNWIYQSDAPFCPRSAWVDILFLANHSESKFRHGAEVISVPRGTFVSSIVKLSVRWKWSRGRVERFVTCLEHEKMLSRRQDSKRTYFTVLNYEQYQGDELPVEPAADRSRSRRRSMSRTGDGQVADTNKNEKKVQEDSTCTLSTKLDPLGGTGDTAPEKADFVSENARKDSSSKLITFTDPVTGTRRRTQVIRLTPAQLKSLEDEFGRERLLHALAEGDDWLVANNERKKDYAAFLRNWMRKDAKLRLGAARAGPASRSLSVTEHNQQFFEERARRRNGDDGAGSGTIIEAEFERVADASGD